MSYHVAGHKHDPWEGGTRVAAFVSGGFVPASLRGTTSGAKLIHISDWYVIKPRGPELGCGGLPCVVWAGLPHAICAARRSEISRNHPDTNEINSLNTSLPSSYCSCSHKPKLLTAIIYENSCMHMMQYFTQTRCAELSSDATHRARWNFGCRLDPS